MNDRTRGKSSPPKTVTVTKTLEESASPKSAGQATRTAERKRPLLTAEEERILRMRYGIAARPEQKLEFEGQEFEDTRLQLALIEQRALQMVSARAAAASAPRRETSPKKDKIIRKLRDLDI